MGHSRARSTPVFDFPHHRTGATHPPSIGVMRSGDRVSKGSKETQNVPRAGGTGHAASALRGHDRDYGRTIYSTYVTVVKFVGRSEAA
jgi:hypothetical protein